jgi:hypothetical protein
MLPRRSSIGLAVLAVALAFGHIHRRLVETDRGTSLPACLGVAASAVGSVLISMTAVGSTSL